MDPLRTIPSLAFALAALALTLYLAAAGTRSDGLYAELGVASARAASTAAR
jgi:hypothetical protein